MDQNQLQELQMIDYQLRQMQQVMETIDNQLLQINQTIEGLEEFAHSSGGEALLPIANGIYAKGTVTSDKTLLVNIGSDIMIEKTIPETISMMREQSLELTNYRRELEEQLNTLMQRMHAHSGE